MMRDEGTSSGGREGGDDGGVSVVIDAGRQRSSCGYCKSGRPSSISHGLWARSLTIGDYQELLDRGWRRSGCYVYKPEMESTCCPSYTIRLKADSFTPSKEQQRVYRRMQRYVDGLWDGKKQELPHKSEDLQGSSYGDEFPSSSKMDYRETNETKNKEEELLDCLSNQIALAIQLLARSGDFPSDIQYPKGLVKKVSPTKKRRIVEGAEDLLYTSNVSFQISAVMKKTEATGSLSDPSPKNIAEKLASALQQSTNSPDFSVKACNGHINFYSLVKETPGEKDNHRVPSFSESSTQHENNKNRDEMIPGNLQKKKRKLEILMNRSSFDPEEFALYRKYQTKVHNDEPDKVSESSYMNFLVDTPLIYIPPTSNNTVPPCGFGSFHQQYRIDGQLIAVGVIDVLPKCLSSKYLFWDPDLAFLSLGKYSALQEISWVKETQHHCPSLEYYYLGYYIHSCPKMRYKAAYSPSELLCPLRYEWVPYDFAKPLLDRKKYAVLSDYVNAQNEVLPLTAEAENLSEQQQNDLVHEDSNDSSFSDDELFPETSDQDAVLFEYADVGDVLLGLRETYVRYKKLKRRLGPRDQAKLEYQLARYMKVVGQELSERMVYSLI